jgi:hypothetical protein
MMRIFFGYRPCFYECGGRGYHIPSEHSYTKYGYENPQSIQTHKRPVTKVNENIILTNKFIDSINQCTVHMLQRFIITSEIISTIPICCGTTNV